MLNDGYVNLDYVVSSVMVDRNIDDRQYEKILHKTIDGYQRLNLTDIITNIKTVYLTVNEQNTAPFPKDYVNYISVSYEFQGRLVPLTFNRNIAMPVNQSCGEWERNSLTDTNEDFKSGGNIIDPVQYTTGGGFNSSYYRIDEANKQIIFLKQRVTGSVFILDYKSSGLGVETQIPRDAIPALVNFVHWQLNIFDRTMSETAIERSRLDWIREKGKLYAMRHSFTMNEYLDLRYKNTYRGLK